MRPASRVVCLVAALSFVLAAGLGLAPAAARAEERLRVSVRVGDWMVTPNELGTHDGVVWRATACRDDNDQDPLTITFSRGGSPTPAKAEHEVNVRNVGPVQVALEQSAWIAQQRGAVGDDRPIFFQPVFWVEREGTRIAVRHVRNIGQQQAMPASEPANRSDSAKLRTLLEAARKEALGKLEQDPALTLLTAMIAKPRSLTQRELAHGYPVVEASVDEGPMQALTEVVGAKGRHCAWHLPAKPGQLVRVRLTMKGRVYELRSDGLTVTDRPDALKGHKVAVAGRTGELDEHGVLTMNVGKLSDVHLLQVSFSDWQSSSTPFSGNLLPRFGRPEEKWLDQGNFPLADQPSAGTPEAVIANLLRDLEAAYDPDQGAFFIQPGRPQVDAPDWAAARALLNLKLDSYPRLQAASKDDASNGWLARVEFYRWSSSPRVEQPLDAETADSLLIKLVVERPRYMGVLHEDLPTPYRREQEVTRGWHHPGEVHVLAVLAKQFPALRERIGLERILDYWVQAIAREPDPVHTFGKGGFGHDLSPEARLSAMGALTLGHELLKKKDYLKARGVLFARMKELLEKQGLMRSITNKDNGAFRSVGRVEGYRSGLPVLEAVGWYGQACAHVGEAEGLRVAQAWITAAIVREGPAETSPFADYAKASFNERAALLAVMRGQAAYLAPPAFAR